MYFSLVSHNSAFYTKLLYAFFANFFQVLVRQGGLPSEGTPSRRNQKQTQAEELRGHPPSGPFNRNLVNVILQKMELLFERSSGEEICKGILVKKICRKSAYKKTKICQKSVNFSGNRTCSQCIRKSLKLASLSASRKHLQIAKGEPIMKRKTDIFFTLGWVWGFWEWKREV